MAIRILLIIAAAYLLGNLNGSVLVSRVMSHDDVRNHGSGNAGLTNFVRSYGGAASLIVLFIDAFKAVAACLIGRMVMAPMGLALEGASAAGLAVILGHIFPVFLGFRGGKGIVSGAAAFLVIDWRCALPALAVFAALYFATYYVSLGSVVAAACIAVLFIIFNHAHLWAVVPAVLACSLAIYMHRENISRLLSGTERKTNFFKRGGTK